MPYRKKGCQGKGLCAGQDVYKRQIVQRTIMAQQEEHKAAMQREAEEGWLNTKQVRELLNVLSLIHI